MGGVTGVHPTFIEKPGVGGFVFGKDEGALGGLENEFVELGELVEGGEAKVAGFLVNADGVPLVNTFYGNVGEGLPADGGAGACLEGEAAVFVVSKVD